MERVGCVVVVWWWWFGLLVVGGSVVFVAWDRCLKAVRQEQLNCFDDVWSDDGTRTEAWWERREGGHYIIMSVVCAPWQTIPRLPISTKRRPKGVLQGSKPVCQCPLPWPAMPCRRWEAREGGGRASAVGGRAQPRYEGQRYLWRLYRCNRMIPAGP